MPSIANRIRTCRKGDCKSQIRSICNKKSVEPFSYRIHQLVQLKNDLSGDREIPEFWNGAKVVIMDRLLDVSSQEPCYKVLLVSLGKICEFKQGEILKGFNQFLS
jgi:hypothetical protein